MFFKLLSEECFVTADEKEIRVCYNDGSANRIAKTDDPIRDARHYKNGSIMFIHGVDRYSVYHPERGCHIKKHSGYKLTRSVSVIPLFRYLAFYDTSASQVRWCLTGEPDLLHNELIDQTMINLVGSEIVTSHYTCLNGEFYTILKKIDSHNIQSDYNKFCMRSLGKSILRNSLLFVVQCNGTLARIAPGKPIPSCIEQVTKTLVERPGESFVNYVLPLTREKVAVSYADGSIKIFDLKTDAVYVMQDSYFHANDIDATSNFLVAASADRVRVFDFYGNDIWDFFQDNTAIKNIRACGDTLAIQFADNSASVINLKLETFSWSSLSRAHALMEQDKIKYLLRKCSCTLL